jgi:hypothetical protein
MKKFIQDNFTIIVLVIALLGFLKSCGDTREIGKLRKEFIIIQNKQDTLRMIEGLKSEKRMIQSTDRRKLDVDRENQIDIEIKKLESNK